MHTSPHLRFALIQNMCRRVGLEPRLPQVKAKADPGIVIVVKTVVPS